MLYCTKKGKKEKRKKKLKPSSVRVRWKLNSARWKGPVSFDRRDDNNHDDRRRREIHFHRTTVACRARHRFETPRESVIGQVGLRWIGEKERRGKETGKERGRRGEGKREGKKKKGVEIIEIQASCFATSSRERTRTAATTTKFHRAAGTSCETRASVWNGGSWP